MVLTTMGRKEYIPNEVLFTKPSLIFGSDTRPGTAVDVAITASGEWGERARGERKGEFRGIFAFRG